MILMSRKELQRVRILDRVSEGKMRLCDAARVMGVSYRHAKRLKREYALKGAEALTHGNRGRTPWHALSSEVRNRVLELSQGPYADFNDTHFTEMLFEREGIDLGRETVRRLRRVAGIPPKRRRRAKKHHGRRTPRSLPGEMVLWDGSPHPWFGSDRPVCCLMAAIDDATGKALSLHFEPTETSVGYLRMLDRVVRKHGVPASVYGDGHGALERNDDHWTIEEELRGEQDPTQVGRVLRDLGIEKIRALSPQAKGRVERLFGTLQDRLSAEMGLEKIDTMEKANPWLKKVFLSRFNRRFGHAPAEKGSLFGKPDRAALAEIISFRYGSVVGNDNAVRLGGLIIDILPGPNRTGYAKARVEVRQLLDGTWRVNHQGTCIARHKATPLMNLSTTRRRDSGAGAEKSAIPSAVATSKTASPTTPVKGAKRPAKGGIKLQAESSRPKRRPLTGGGAMLPIGGDGGQPNHRRQGDIFS